MKEGSKKIVGGLLAAVGLIAGYAALKQKGVFSGTLYRCADSDLSRAQNWMANQKAGNGGQRIDPLVQEAMHSASGMTSKNAAAFSRVLTRCNPPVKVERYVPNGIGRPVGE